MIGLSLHPRTPDPDEAIKIREEFRQRQALAWKDCAVDPLIGVEINHSGDVLMMAIAVLTYPDMVTMTEDASP